MNERHQQIYDLHKSGKSYSDIVRMLGVSRGTVASSLRYARKALNADPKAPRISGNKRGPLSFAERHSFTPTITVPSFEAAVFQDTCRHISGDIHTGATYCGHARYKGRSFCDGHLRACYTQLNI